MGVDLEAAHAQGVDLLCVIGKVLDLGQEPCPRPVDGGHVGGQFTLVAPEQGIDRRSGELTRQFLGYDIQAPEELIYKVAGLTIGNAAGAWLLRRTPFEGGCIRLQTAQTMSLPSNWHLCSAPIDGSFTSFSSDLFKLNVHCAPEIKRTIEKIGWTPEEVDHFVFHQPSKNMVDRVLTDLGVPTDRGVHTFHLFANTSSTTVPIAMHQTLIERDVKPGDKIVLSSAAAGFSMATMAGEWVA